MMSCACGLRFMGSSFLYTGLSMKSLAASFGVRELVAEVSITSVSAVNSSEWHLGHGFPGSSSIGSTGSFSVSASIGSSHFLQYHTGKGMPKYLCLDMLQSHCSPLAQLSYLLRMCSGYQLSLAPCSSNFSLRSSTLMNHCFFTRNSISVPHLSWTFTACLMCSCFFSRPQAFSSSVIFFLASLMVNPLYFWPCSFSFPSSVIEILSGS